MTTPPQPAPAPSRSKKLPTPSGKPASPLPLPSAPAPAPPSDMNYHDLPASSAAYAAADPAAPSHDYRPAAPMYTVDANNQLARINRGGQGQLMRMPQYAGMQQDLAYPGQMGMGSMLGPYGGMQQMDTMVVDQLEPAIQERIGKMKKKRASIPPFVLKLSSFVNDPNTDNLIRWSPAGNSFLVLDEDEFSRTLIPDLFKHNNYASFVRQLNMYGFHKVVGLADGSLKTSEQRSKPPSEYENPYFKRGQPDLMWLIQKPKSKQKRPKKGKQEEADSEQEGNGSEGAHGVGEGETTNAGGYLEGPKDAHDSAHKGPRPDIQALMAQLEAVRNHQAMISAAINRLRKDHQQLYEQSIAFQSLHQKHEHSINAILQFLASVYDKSVSGNLPGAFNNLFGAAHQVEHPGGGHALQRPGSGMSAINGSIVPATNPARPASQLRTPMPPRRQPLLLEGAPRFLEENGNYADGQGEPPASANSEPAIKQSNSPPTYTSQHITELFTPTQRGTASSTPSPRDESHLAPPSQYAANNNNNAAANGYSPLFQNLPETPTSPNLPSPRGNSPNGTATPRSATIAPRTLPPMESKNALAASSSALQAHTDQLAHKAREIQELEDLQVAQDENVNHLMSMIVSYAGAGAGQPTNTTTTTSSPTTTAANANATSEAAAAAQAQAEAEASAVDDFFDWGLPSDVDAPYANGSRPVSNMEDIDELLGTLTDANAAADYAGLDPFPTTTTGGPTPSTVAQSPAASTSSRAREEIDEEVEEVQPKRRKLG